MAPSQTANNTHEHGLALNPDESKDAPKGFLDRFRRKKPAKQPKITLDIPQTSIARREETLSDVPIDISNFDKNTKGTFLYLAYGSNLCDETFLGMRGIRPLSSINVLVPELRMTFDLPGIPYIEPCFANSARRDQKKEAESKQLHKSTETSPLLSNGKAQKEYRKDSWKKGMVGVVYEVTASDYARIIATEGGGASYHDVLIGCHALSTDQTEPVPWVPENSAFKAHTLFAPGSEDGDDPPKNGGRIRRPDPSYAQPSARYLKLITDGAKERKLPNEYQDYLDNLQPYTMTTQKQRLGAWVISSTWVPFIMLIFALSRKFSDEKGVSPPWVIMLKQFLFQAVWASYDGFFKAIFGDGERTYEKGDPDGEESLPEYEVSNEKSSIEIEEIEEETARGAV